MLACKKKDELKPGNPSSTGSFSYYRNDLLIDVNAYAPRPLFVLDPYYKTEAGYFGTLSISGDTVKKVFIGSWKVVTPGDTVELFFQISNKPKRAGIVQGMTLPIVTFWESVFRNEADAWVYYAYNSLAGKGYSITSASGSLQLEKLDVINKRVSGIFSCTFTGNRPGNSSTTVQIKNGKFENLIIK